MLTLAVAASTLLLPQAGVAKLNKRTRFHWLTKARSGDQAHLCHQQRCSVPAVASRLCSEHLSWWITQEGSQPPMPDYEGKSKTVELQMAAERRQADEEYKRISGLPMRTLVDASAMKDEADGAEEFIEMLRASKHDSLKPLLEQAASIKKAHDAAISRYADCKALAELRLKEFDHLHDFEVGEDKRPARQQSGIPTLAGLRPGVVRRAR